MWFSVYGAQVCVYISSETSKYIYLLGNIKIYIYLLGNIKIFPFLDFVYVALNHKTLTNNKHVLMYYNNSKP
jgi:hypothetical protein